MLPVASRRGYWPMLPADLGPRLAVLPTATLRRVLDSVFAMVRLSSLLPAIGALLLWRGWYTRHPTGLLVAALAICWSLAFAVTALRRGINRPLAGANVLVAVVLTSGVRWWLPPGLVNDPASWTALAATHAMSVAAWTFPPAWFWAAVALTTGAATGGAAVAGSPSSTPAMVVLAVSVLIRFLLPRLHALAEGVERRLVRVAESREAELALRAVLRARRERELVIHNGVLNTLTGIAWGGATDAELTRRRCADGESALRGLLGEGEAQGGAAQRCEPAPDAIRAMIAAELNVVARTEIPLTGVVAAPATGLPGQAGDAWPQPLAAAWATSVRDGYAAQLRRVTGGFALVWLVLLAVPAARAVPQARSLPLTALLFAGPVAIAWLARRRFRSGPLSAWQTAAVVVACVLIALVGPWNAGSGAMRSWPLMAVAPLMMVVTVSRSPWRWVVAAFAVTAAMVGATLTRYPGDSEAAVRLLLAVHHLWIMQVILVLVGPVLWRTADARAWAGHFERELRRGAELDDRVRERRRGLLRSVEREVVPLLAAVAAGQVDPRADAVRGDCGRRAVAVRRLLFDDDAVHGALGDVIDAAERRGTVVSSQIHGGLDQLPAAVRREFVEHLHDALLMMPSRRVLLTVTTDEESASLFLSCPWPARQQPPAPAGQHLEMIVDVDDDRLCLELRWPAERHPASAVPVA
ncbi:Signal transduction histidine kinase [Frankia sp. AgKG'84/4]